MKTVMTTSYLYLVAENRVHVGQLCLQLSSLRVERRRDIRSWTLCPTSLGQLLSPDPLP